MTREEHLRRIVQRLDRQDVLLTELQQLVAQQQRVIETLAKNVLGDVTANRR